jgi:4-aminobutyrate aminotransferase-like enzyme
MHGQLPLVWDKAEGFNIFDKFGNCWIDFTSGIFFSNVGHSNPRITKALKNAIDKPLIGCYAYPNSIRADYLEKLIDFAGNSFEKGFLLSAGTETTEAAIKLMRLNGIKEGKKKLGIICIENNWHGRTLGAQMLSSNVPQKEWIGYQDQDIHYIPFPYPWNLGEKSGSQFLLDGITELENKGINISTDICGFMLETFQGWGAVFYPSDYVQGIRKLSSENNILLTFDEMQAGFGRTGKLFGYEHYEVEPDILCCGKGASSGLPLSFVIGSKDIMDLPGVGSMSSTHSANPLVCVAGHQTLISMYEDNLIHNSEKLGVVLHQELNKLKYKYPNHIKHVMGKGLLAALIFQNQESERLSALCDLICEKAFQKGLLVVHTGRESIKLAPPLSISKDALLEGVAVLDECIRESI